jgi:uracil-DNA glycosylase family 4
MPQNNMPEGCLKCPLNTKDQLSPNMKTSGEGRLGILIVGECYSEDTEVLTNFGWKKFYDLNGSELFHSVNPTNHQIELVKAIHQIRRSYSGYLFYYKTRSVDLLITPDHALYASTSHTRKFKLQPIQSIKSNTFEMLAIGSWAGEKEANPFLMKFLGFWLGDGWKENCNGGYCIRFKLKKERKIKYITDVLDGLNIKYHKHLGSGKWNKGYTSINFCDKNLYQWLPGGNVYTKRIPQDIFAYSKQSLLSLLDGIIEADGNRATKHIFSSNKNLIDDIQQLCILCGYPATIGSRYRTKDLSREIIKGYPIQSIKESYTLSIQKRRAPFTLKKSNNLSKIKYNGFVWDVTLEKNHILIVRRNGRAIFSSNCQGEREAVEGAQFVGVSGGVLRAAISNIGYDLDRDFYKTNAVRCFVSSNVQVYTDNGYKPLRFIKEGDLVLTHKGRFKRVTSLIHDLPLEQRKNTELLVKIKTKFKEYTVTASHLFLKNGEWIKAQDLKVGYKLTVLGEKCKECGEVYYKNPLVFDKAESTCSPRCHNTSIQRKIDPQKISASMLEQYKTGVRDRFKITKAANNKMRILAQKGELNLQKLTPEQRRGGRVNSAKSRQRYNKLFRSPSVGKGERQLACWLTKNNIDFYHQFAIENLSIDFYIPQHNLLIEVENPKSYIANKRIKNETYKKREALAEKENKHLIFLSSEEPEQQLSRILKNHNHQYYFTETEILEVKLFQQTRQKYLYSLDVEEDHSFIAGGIVHHNCRPPVGKKPTKKAITCCNTLLYDSIRKRKPKVVLALGTSALTALIGKYVNKITISKFRGCIIPIPEHNFFLASTLHPSFVNRQWPPDDDFAYRTMKNDIKDAINYCKYLPDNLQVDPLELNKQVVIVTDFTTFNVLMDKIDQDKPVVAFDYETSCLKPHNASIRRVWSMSICFGGVSYSFPVYYPKVPGVFPKNPGETFWGKKHLPTIIKKIVRFLKDPKIFKIAHNEAFERIWSYFTFKTDVANLSWCSMTNQHILDSRKEFCGLKLQAFLRWGVHGYDDEVKKYLPESPSGYQCNTLHELPMYKLLLYGGIDSLLTLKLAQEQKETFNFGNNKPLKEAARLFHSANVAFTDCQKTGIRIDSKYLIDTSYKLEGDIYNLEKSISDSDPVALFVSKEKRPFKMNSPKDLRTLLFTILGETSEKLTATGLDSVDKTVLAELKTPLAKDIVRVRELTKLKDTYIAQWVREGVDGVVYPFFHTHTTRSGRSSGNLPNPQNLPKRNEEAKKLIRSGIFPFKGHRMLEGDFSGIEVRVIGCATRDKTLLKYLWDPKSDMHYDQTKELFLLDDSQMNKALRYNGKSDYVFLEFYGGEAASSAKYLWHDSVDLKLGPDADGPTLLKHLRSKGIRNLEDYISHVTEVEKAFWKKYTGVRAWQKNQCKFYQDHGYIETPFGFRRSGYLSKNAILNTRIQSTAAHFLWWCYIKINKISKEEGWESKLLGQIHDSILMSVLPKEEEHVLKTLYRIMTIEAPKEFDWVITPIDVEIELGGVDEPWYNLKEISEDYYSVIKDQAEKEAVTKILKGRVNELYRNRLLL